MELLFNLNAGVYFPDEPERTLVAVDIFETLMLAWELGCKAIYYIRTIQKDSFKESNEQCVACANSIPVNSKQLLVLSEVVPLRGSKLRKASRREVSVIKHRRWALPIAQ